MGRPLENNGEWSVGVKDGLVTLHIFGPSARSTFSMSRTPASDMAKQLLAAVQLIPLEPCARCEFIPSADGSCGCGASAKATPHPPTAVQPDPEEST